MKNTYITIIFSVVFILINTACNTDLDEEFKSRLAPSDITSDEDATNVVNGVYSRLLGNGWGYHGYGQVISINDVASDVMQMNNALDNLETFNWSVDEASGIWSAAYEMIQRANIAIETIGANSEAINSATVLIAEAKFLRALGFYDLVRVFGDVPLRLEATNEDNANVLMSRTPKAEIFAQLESDLTESAADLPDLSGGLTVGRATKGAALMLLAKIKLMQRTVGDGNTAEWSEVQGVLDELIGIGVYDLYSQAEGPYKKLWAEGSRKDNEFIFVAMARGLEYAVASNHHVQRFTPWSWDAGWGGNVGVPSEIYFSMDVSDLRRHGSMSASFEDGLTGWYTQTGGWDYYGIPYYSYPLTNTFTEYADAYNLTYRGFATGYASAWTADWLRPGVAVLMKYAKDNKLEKDAYQYYSNMNQPIFRYADALLLKAEVENELGNMSAAESALNEVIGRVGVAPVSGLSQVGFRTEVLKHRALELVGEGMRREDLIRYDVFESTMNAYFAKRAYGNTPTVTSDYRVFPIPQIELDLNPKMTTNPLN